MNADNTPAVAHDGGDNQTLVAWAGDDDTGDGWSYPLDDVLTFAHLQAVGTRYQDLLQRLLAVNYMGEVVGGVQAEDHIHVRQPRLSPILHIVAIAIDVQMPAHRPRWRGTAVASDNILIHDIDHSSVV